MLNWQTFKQTTVNINVGYGAVAMLTNTVYLQSAAGADVAV